MCIGTTLSANRVTLREHLNEAVDRRAFILDNGDWFWGRTDQRWPLPMSGSTSHGRGQRQYCARRVQEFLEGKPLARLRRAS